MITAVIVTNPGNCPSNPPDQPTIFIVQTIQTTAARLAKIIIE